MKTTPVSQIEFILEKKDKEESSEEDQITQHPDSQRNSDAQMCDYRGMIEEEQSQLIQTPKSKDTADAMNGQKVSMGDFGTFDSNPFDVSQSTNNLAL